MPENQNDPRHLETLDRDLARFSNLEAATSMVGRPMVGVGVSFIFVVMAGLAAMLFFGQASNSYIVIIAACLGAYMALNIGGERCRQQYGPCCRRQCALHGGRDRNRRRL